jgi:hypothetical protein
MNIDKKQIKEAPKKIGILKGRDVFQCRLKGGLYVTTSNGKVLGAGSRAVIARHLAQKYEPDIEFTELSKSEHVDIEAYSMLLPKYEELTKELMELQESK